MSELVKYINEKKKKKGKSTITVPATFGGMEEAKVEKLYAERERFLQKKIAKRDSHRMKYGTDEESIGDQVTRHGVVETAYYGGLLGEHSPLTRDQFIALQRLRLATESSQSRYGAQHFATQDIARLLRCGKDNIAPFCITRSDVDVERVVVSNGMESPFSGMNVELGKGESMDKQLFEEMKRKKTELEEMGVKKK